MDPEVKPSSEAEISSVQPEALSYASLPKPLQVRAWINTANYRASPGIYKSIQRLVLEDKLQEAYFLAKESLSLGFRKQSHLPSDDESASRLANYMVLGVKSTQVSRYYFNHVPYATEDIEVYFDELHPAYKKVLKKLYDQAPGMHEDCKASISIPVAVCDEGPYIYQTLASFSNQTVSNTEFEILLLLNCPEGHENDPKAAITREEVSRFKEDYPDVCVQVADVTLKGGSIKRIGFIRSLVTDLSVYRHWQREGGKDHILIRCDADTRSVHPEYIENYLRLFKQNPLTDAFSGELRWTQENCRLDPLLFINQTLYDIVVSGRRIYEGRASIGGPNFAVKASMYCYVGGYAEYVELGEDLKLGQMLLELRNGWSKYTAIEHAGSKSKLYTSTRRAEAAFLNDVNCLEQWSSLNTSFKDMDPVREIREIKRNDRPLEELLPKIEILINNSINTFYKFFPGFDTYAPELHKALGLYLGFDYEILDKKTVKILNADLFYQRWKSLNSNQDSQH